MLFRVFNACVGLSMRGRCIAKHENLLLRALAVSSIHRFGFVARLLVLRGTVGDRHPIRGGVCMSNDGVLICDVAVLAPPSCGLDILQKKAGRTMPQDALDRVLRHTYNNSFLDVRVSLKRDVRFCEKKTRVEYC